MQRSFDDLGMPLSSVTFVVLDLETTGGSPASCAITEIGAVKVRGGEALGTFQTLVDPGTGIPPAITYLTGITEAMVVGAPAVDAVLPAFLEFLGDAVVVGHNVRFDLGFLNEAARRLGYDRLTNHVVDTCSLARRLVRDEVPNLRLGTLARHFRTASQPTHRALDDARATAELLHVLLERATGLGVLGLDDLLALPSTAAHPQVSKLRLVQQLPRSPGVYLFRDHAGRVLYVGKAADLRRRVRSYFSSDDRRKIDQLLREAAAIEHRVTSGALESAVLEVRLIHEHLPRFNHQAKVWSKYAYLKLTLTERFPRLSVVRVARAGDGCFYLGPLASSAAAKLVAEAVESVVPLRRCTARPGRSVGAAPCMPAQLGRSLCPCAGGIDEGDYGAAVQLAVRGLTSEPHLLLRPLSLRMAALSAEHRFEEAAATRDRAAALVEALRRQRRFHSLRGAGRLAVELDGGGGAVIEHGRLLAAWGPGGSMPAWPLPGEEVPLPVPRHLADELLCVARWLDEHAGRLRVLHCDGAFASMGRPLPTFAAGRQRLSAAVA